MNDWSSSHPARRFLPPEGINAEVARNQVLMNLFPRVTGSEITAIHLQAIEEHLVVIVVRPWAYSADLRARVDEATRVCGLTLANEEAAVNDGRNYWT
jgi:hypothetical protein